MADTSVTTNVKRKGGKRRRKTNLFHDQASDSVVWSVVRKFNSRRRAYANFKRFPYFTHNSNNLTQLDTWRTSGYRQQTVGLRKQKAAKGHGETFVLKMKKRGTRNKPNQQLVLAQVVVGNKKKIAKQVDAQTRYRNYRSDLNKLAQKRIWRTLESRSAYKRFVRRETKRIKATKGDQQSRASENANLDNEDTMQMID